MDYKVTFDDGSSGYLEHYGVKGMKWRKGRASGLSKLTGRAAREYAKSNAAYEAARERQRQYRIYTGNSAVERVSIKGTGAIMPKSPESKKKAAAIVSRVKQHVASVVSSVTAEKEKDESKSKGKK